MSKFKAGDHVRVTDPKSYVFDQVGVICRLHSGDHSRWIVDFNGALWGCVESTLTLADPDVHTVLDQMDAESAPTQFDRNLKAIQDEKNTDLFGNPLSAKDLAEREIDGEYVPGKACVAELPKTGVTAEDKLRMIADTVDAQTPSGSELASFRRRLSAILSIGHDV